MRTITEHKSPWSTVASGALAVANAGALLGVIALTLALLTATPVFAQTIDMGDISIKMHKMDQDLSDVAEEVQRALEEVEAETGIKINIDSDDNDSRPRLGVYLSNLDFEDAYKMRYPYAHGVLVNGTVDGGNADNAGLIEDDVIMYFDGTKVLYEDHLVRLIRTKKFGDSAELVYWRDEAIDTTMVTFAMPVKAEKDVELTTVDTKEEKKRKHSRGYGGGGFTPMLVEDDFIDVDNMMRHLGMTSTPFDENGIVLLGGSGQGYVGNGWYLGGFGNGTAVSASNDVTHSTNGTEVKRKITFGMGYGGLTIEKRIAPFSFATLGAGVGLGGASMQLGIEQTDGGFTWNTDPANGPTLGDQLIETSTTAVTFSKNYAMVHPRVNMMIRLTGWMRLKAEYGYLYGYSFTDGWKTTLDGGNIENTSETFILEDSPNTELGASTISLGLWFGF